MKCKKMFVFLIISVFLFVGCVKNNKEDVVKKLFDKIEKTESYNLQGTLEIISNENSYFYDVSVAYLKENNFRVSLKNKTNNHEQIILRNDDGVYVLTPSLNKSFKFQSEWPYNSSQSYLLHNLLNDIKSDADYFIEEINNEYVINTLVNYSNNKELLKQKIYVDSDSNIFKVEVLDSNDLVKMRMDFHNIEYSGNFDKDYFKLDNNMNVSSEETNDLSSVSKLDDVIYPMYIPQNTYLSTQDKVAKEDGERVIMTFSGDHPFMLIQETVSINNDVVSVYGDPFQLADSIGVLDDSSLTWINDGIEYYLVSNSLDKEQLVSVANSLTGSLIETYNEK